MSKPTPAHHRSVDLPRSAIAKGYGGIHVIPALGGGEWRIVAAAPSSHVPGSGPAPAMVGVIVAPAWGKK